MQIVSSPTFVACPKEHIKTVGCLYFQRPILYGCIRCHIAVKKEYITLLYHNPLDLLSACNDSYKLSVKFDVDTLSLTYAERGCSKRKIMSKLFGFYPSSFHLTLFYSTICSLPSGSVTVTV